MEEAACNINPDLSAVVSESLRHSREWRKDSETIDLAGLLTRVSNPAKSIVMVFG